MTAKDDGEMLKIIGNSPFETCPVSECNLKATDNMPIYQVQSKLECCPFCGDQLRNNFVYGTQISERECVKIKGDACHHCNAFFTKGSELIEWLKRKDFNKGKPEIFDNYDVKYNKPRPKFDKIPIFNTQTTVYVYRGEVSCHYRHHPMEEVRVILPFVTEELCFYAEYCHECNKYLMSFNHYETYLKRFKLFPSKVVLTGNGQSFDDFYRAEMSPLRLNGYTVNEKDGHSKAERQRVLKYVMDYGILKKEEVLKYLRMFINNFQGNYRNRNAVAKWEEDRLFTLNYSPNPVPLVVAGKIEPYRKKQRE